MFNGRNFLSLSLYFLMSVLFLNLTACGEQEFVVSVDKPLRVLSIIPADGTDGIALGTDIRVTFSEDILETTLTKDSFVVTDVTDSENTVTVEGEIKYTAETLTAVFTPAAELKYSSRYEVVLKTTIERADTSNSTSGNLAIETKTVFSTIDPDRLTVIYTDPGSGSWNVPIDKKIKVVFSHPVTKNSMIYGSSFIVEDITDAESPAMIEHAEIDGMTFSEDMKTVTFTPKGIYGYSKEMRLTLTTDISTAEATGVSGFLSETITIPFGTVNPPALSIESVISGSGSNPMKHEISGAPDTLVITFSEGVDQDSVTDNIIFEDVTGLANPKTDPSNSVINGTLAWNGKDDPDPSTLIGSDNVATFTPEDLLKYGTKIRVTLKGSPAPSMDGLLSDRATVKGGQLEETKIYLLDVEIIPDLVVTKMTPGNGSDQIPIDQSVTLTLSEGVDCSTISIGGEDSSVTFVFDATDPENADGEVVSAIAPDCTDGDTEVTFVPETEIKYSRDVKLVLDNSVASLRAKDINTDFDPLQGHVRDGYTATYSTIDPAILGVVSVGTASGSFLMAVDDAVVVKFSEGVAQSTVIPGTSFIVEDVTGLENPLTDTANETIAGGITFNAVDNPDPDTLIGTDNTLTFIPTENFPYGTMVRVTIPGSVVDVEGIIKSDRATVRGGYHTQDVVFLVEVRRLEELKVLTTVPAHDNRNVLHTANTITVTFSAAPDCTTINNTNIIVKYDDGVFTVDPIDGAAGTVIGGSWVCNTDDPVITFTADAEFGYGRDFAVMLSENIRDARAGNVSIYDPTQGHLVPAFNFGFGTEHMGLVQIVACNASGSISYPRDLPIEIVFDPEINCDTIGDDTVYIYRSDSSDPLNEKLAATIECTDPASDTITITPVDDTADSSCDGTALCYDTDYTLVIKGGYEGVCVEGKLTGDISDDGCVKSPERIFKFHTGESPALSVVIDPVHDSLAVSPSIKPTCTFSKAIKTATVESEPASNPEFPDPDGVVPNICLVKGKNQNNCESPDVVALDPLTPYSFTAGDTVVTINPATTLDTEEWYTVIVSRDIEDTTGIRLTAFNTASFKTSPGGLLNKVYAEGDTLDTLKVVVEFNEDVDVDTVGEGTLYLSYVNEFGGTTFVPGTVELSNWSGTGTCDPLAGDINCDKATLTPDFSKLYACGETSADTQYELPMNTDFDAHISTFIKNAAWGTSPLHVPSTVGENEFIYSFKTPESSIIESVTYSNLIVGTTSVGGADDVPVNSSFTIRFSEAVDPSTLNSDTIKFEDGRGDDGITVNGSTTFDVTTAGTFNANDTGKFIHILYGEDTGSYQITSVISDTSIELDTSLTVAATEVSWSKILDGSGFDFTVSGDATSVTVTPDTMLAHHSDYSGNNANVTGSTVTIDPLYNNLEIKEERDLGRLITISGSADPDNNVTATIIAVNETNNSVTVNTALSSAENGLNWWIHNDRGYHSIKILGRTRSNKINYIKDAVGNPVPGVLTLNFTTSPETYVKFNPEAVINPGEGQRSMALFSRPVITQSVNQNTLYYMVEGEKYYTLPTFYSHDLRYVLMTPIPSYKDGHLDINLVATSGIYDYRGNPVVERQTYLGESGGAPATNAITPSDGAVVTPANGANIKGNQRFRLAWQGVDDKRYSMNAGMIHDGTVDLVEIINTGTDAAITTGTSTLEETGNPFQLSTVGNYVEISGATDPSDNGRFEILAATTNTLTLDHTFNSDSTTIAWTIVKKYSITSNYFPNLPDNGDVAEFKPIEGGRDAYYMPAGANMRLKVYFSLIANLYNFSTLTSEDITYYYTVESDSPTLASTDIKVVSETLGLIEADGATDVKHDSKIFITFNEDIDPDTIFFDSIKLTDKDTNAVSCDYDVRDNVVTVIPAAGLKSTLSDYTLSINTDIKNVAGNNLAAPVTITFGVETTQPTIIDTIPADATAGWSVNEPLSIIFSEGVDESTLSAGIDVSFTIPAACNSPEATGILEGCIAVDRKETGVTFTPYSGHFVDETAYTLGIYNTISDIAGNILSNPQDIDFDTIGGDNGASAPVCSEIPVSTATDYVDIYFSEPLNPTTVVAETVIAYNADTSEEVTGIVTLENGNTVIRFTADSSFSGGVNYGIIITQDIEGTDGLVVESGYRVFFKIVP